MMKPFFLTVDTEGDNIWDRPKFISSRNTEKLYRFQELCEQYRIKPIYLTNYEASENLEFRKFIDQHKENLEVGLHLHAWNSPPKYCLTKDDYYYQPYLHEYPKEIIIQKIDYLIKHLTDIFQTEIVSHRGGRYSINEHIFEALSEGGIKIDCSIVPGIDWSHSLGSPNGKGGPDFKNSPSNIHILPHSIIEIPVSTYRTNAYFNILKNKNILKRLGGKVFNYKNAILRSKINNLKELKKIVNWNLKNDVTHLEYIIHSSELVNGESSLIRSTEEENIFYFNLELFFQFLQTLDIESSTFKNYLKNLV